MLLATDALNRSHYITGIIGIFVRNANKETSEIFGKFASINNIHYSIQ